MSPADCRAPGTGRAAAAAAAAPSLLINSAGRAVPGAHLAARLRPGSRSWRSRPAAAGAVGRGCAGEGGRRPQSGCSSAIGPA